MEGSRMIFSWRMGIINIGLSISRRGTFFQREWLLSSAEQKAWLLSSAEQDKKRVAQQLSEKEGLSFFAVTTLVLGFFLLSSFAEQKKCRQLSATQTDISMYISIIAVSHI
jgi:hypothetical protein